MTKLELAAKPMRYCPSCFSWEHSLWRAAKGWLAWNLVCRGWPLEWGLPPFLATAGDWIYDTRGCGCRVPLIDESRGSCAVPLTLSPHLQPRK